MKKLSALLLSFLLVFVCATGVLAQEDKSTNSKDGAIWLNNEQVDLGNHKIVTEDGLTYIPLRVILENLDYSIVWDSTHKVVLADKYDFIVGFQVGQAVGYINGSEIELNAAPRLIGDITYVSLESLNALLGLKLESDSQLNKIILSSQESKGFIWKVEKDDVDVYLLGSIHVGQNNMYPLRDEIEEAFLNADNLVVEVNTSQQPDEKTMADIQALQTYTDGNKLQDHVSAETYERLQAFLKEIGLPTNTYDTYKPWAIYLDINTLLTASTGYDSGLGIDLYFMFKAQKDIKPILELESYHSQLSMFDSYSDELQEQLITEALDELYGISNANASASTEPSVEVLAKLWIEGNDEQLEQLVAAFKGQEEMYEKLLKNRHPQMIEKIEGYLNNKDNETYFVIAGYLHMLGEDGLITLLKEKGYEVTRM